MRWLESRSTDDVLNLSWSQWWSIGFHESVRAPDDRKDSSPFRQGKRGPEEADLTENKINQLLARYDQTAPELQRGLLETFIGQNVRLRELQEKLLDGLLGMKEVAEEIAYFQPSPHRQKAAINVLELLSKGRVL